jgi:hypothetical protein
MFHKEKLSENVNLPRNFRRLLLETRLQIGIAWWSTKVPSIREFGEDKIRMDRTIMESSKSTTSTGAKLAKLVAIATSTVTVSRTEKVWG